MKSNSGYDRIKQAFLKTIVNLKTAVPIIIGVFMFISYFNPLLQKYYPSLFSGNLILDPLIGAIGGSIFFGMPITSYIAGGKLMENGVSMIAITAFIMAWTSVGVAMLPLEIEYMGKRFAISRNIMNFMLAIIIAILTAITLVLI